MGRWAPGWRVAGVLLLGGFLTWVALALAIHHPVAPVAVTVGLLMTAMLVGWRPHAMWFLLPALLPVMSFAPWTGWTLGGRVGPAGDGLSGRGHGALGEGPSFAQRGDGSAW